MTISALPVNELGAPDNDEDQPERERDTANQSGEAETEIATGHNQRIKHRAERDKRAGQHRQRYQ